MGSRSDRYDEEDVNWSGEEGINWDGGRWEHDQVMGYDEDEVNWTGNMR